MLFCFYSCAQEKKAVGIIGNWEIVKTERSSTGDDITIDKLIVTDSSYIDSEKHKEEDFRYQKRYFTFSKDYHIEYKNGKGHKFKSKIDKKHIYKFDHPYYEIILFEDNKLKIRSYAKETLYLERTGVDLSDLIIED